MIRNDISLGLGAAQSYTRWTITPQDLQSMTGSGPKTVVLPRNPSQPGQIQVTPTLQFQVPQGGKIMAYLVHVVTAFAGGSLSALSMSIGKQGGSSIYISTPIDIFTAGGDTVVTEGGPVNSAQQSAWGVTLTFTPTTDLVSAVTGGQVDLYLLYINGTNSLVAGGSNV